MGSAAQRRLLGELAERRAATILGAVGAEAEVVTTSRGPGASLRNVISAAAALQVPVALAALIAEDPEREVKLAELAELVARTDMHRVPAIARLGLARLGLRLAREAVREDATRAGYDADALVEEFARFEEALIRTVFPPVAVRPD